MRREYVKSKRMEGAYRLWSGDTLVSATCVYCGELTEVGNLVSSASKPGGKTLTCKPCMAGNGRKHYQQNSEAVLKKVKHRYHSHIERERERARLYALRYPEKNKQRHADFRGRNREVRAAQTRAWREANPDIARQREAQYRATEHGRANRATYTHKRRALMQSVNCGCVDNKAMKLIWELDGGSCAYCSAPGEHYDHLMPISRGGMHCVSNLRIACAKCNLSKSVKTAEEFSPERPISGLMRCEK